MSHIQDNLNDIRDRILQACKKACRKQEEVTLLAVSKTFPTDVLFEAMQYDQFLFAENKVQELVKKKEDSQETNAQIHLIGPLQSNKINKAVEYADAVHSIGDIEIARKMNTACQKINKKMPIFLQVNTSNEAQKSGLANDISTVQSIVSEIQQEHLHLELQGFMTMGPFTIDEQETKRCFSQLYQLRASIEQNLNIKLAHLSMGMSHDFEWAIDEGSTMLRIGNAIFGKRDYQL